MKKEDYKYIFGPVPSRRLGFSLGIDVVPFKTCSYDCIYCQLGRTTDKTITRKEFMPVPDIMNELKHKLEKSIRIDYITLSGSGEPALYSKVGELITGIKQVTGIPVAVLTNGSLLWDKGVREELNKADVVIPSLDAGDENMYRYVNRPCKDLAFEKVVEGIISFAADYKDKIWLEVFLLNGVTSIQAEVMSINKIIKKINPGKIQLNTVKRPPAESFAFTVPYDEMLKLSQYFNGNVEIISDFTRKLDEKYMQATKEEIISLLRRRPCSLDDISCGLNLHMNEVLKYIDVLIKGNNILMYDQDHTIYYSVK